MIDDQKYPSGIASDVHTEKVGPHEWRTWEIKEEIGRIGEARVVELYDYGRALILDGRLQCTESDYHIIHEMSIHPILSLLRGSIEDVFIMGAGEGAMAKEVLKYPEVGYVLNVDISQDVAYACRKYLSFMGGEAFLDPRMNLVIDDAWKMLGSVNQKWDLIVCNVQCSGNTEDDDFATFSFDQIRLIKDRLKEDGFFTTFGYTTFYNDQKEVIKSMIDLFCMFFKYVNLSHVMIPSYGCEAIIFYCSDDCPEFTYGNRMPISGTKTYSEKFYLASTVFPRDLILPGYSPIFGEWDDA